MPGDGEEIIPKNIHALVADAGNEESGGHLILLQQWQHILIIIGETIIEGETECEPVFFVFTRIVIIEGYDLTMLLIEFQLRLELIDP